MKTYTNRTKSLLCVGFTAAIVFASGCNQSVMTAGRDAGGSASQEQGIDIWPSLDIVVKPSADEEARVKALLADMTLEQKIAQMIQPEIRDISVEDMRKYGFGSYLNGGGAFPNNNKHSTPQDWINLAEDMYQASIDASIDGSSIPTMWGTDAVHGHNNVIGATLFPHNIGLGAANNPALIEKIAKVTATEVMVTGIDWVFAPTVATVQDDRWGRTYESYSENPQIVYAYSKAIVKGLQGSPGDDFLGDSRVISTVKHFIGDGGTVGGDDQGNNIDSERDLFEIHGQGYVGGLSAGAQSVMASFNSWHGKKLHGDKYLITDVLKEKMGFDGFVVGDWNGHGQVKGCDNTSCPQAANAGLDIYMVPTDAWKPLYENLIQQVKDGVIPMSRIDDAVTRILRVKVRAGLFEKPSPAKRQFSGKTELIGQQSHRDIAKQAVRESLVLLKNKAQLLPLDPNMNVLVAGDAAHNIGKQSGGWTITWQGTNNTNDDFPGGSSIFDGIEQQVLAAGGTVSLNESGDYSSKPDVAIVVFGEEPYAEGHGDREHLDYQRGSKSDLALLQKLKADNIPVVSVFISGRPMWVNAELNASDAFVAAWLPGSEGDAVAEVLFKTQDGDIQYDMTGRLSFSWPARPDQTSVNLNDEDYAPLLPYGFGLSYGDKNLLASDLNEKYEVSAKDSQGRTIFTGSLQQPWELWLMSGTHMQPVTASTASVESLNYRTVDRIVQEDAFRLSFEKSSSGAGMQIASKSFFREDMYPQSQNKAVLSFMLKTESAIPDEVILGMNCESEGDPSGSCRGQVNIADLLKDLPANTWSELSIDTRCFTQQGVKFENMVSPFQLSSKEALSLSISDIAFKFEQADTADMRCQ
ncbi:glycoside hydrolase family 3 C-terminal domain-containing protein [Glaciecola sp. MH2013]|uniref:glycoside hydrolase family 3 protein n=1 Tax=Glaciecola sp. MH2013 TaxID=2785524 RepID=UPI0018A0577E|nr:exo 1,3/1,4-beta-D-glucan glucohydrolase [Glaciecola sp. MH2013]MBF7074229.1 glycoside hydrolase family 3 C-terminal domain-containing protein [Glaciecola sp. MH2013]